LNKKKTKYFEKDRIQLVLWFFVLILYTSNLKAQNYVLNPSFEEINPNELPENPTYKDLTGVKNWWSKSSSDIYTLVKKTNPVNSVLGETIHPRSGNNFAGIISLGQSKYREYLIGRLNTTLIKGKTYEISIFVKSLAHSGYIQNAISIAFVEQFYQPKIQGRIKKKLKKINLFYKDYLYPKLGWIKLNGVYVADGTENFLIIGTFEKKSKLKYLKYQGAQQSYFVIDDVSITDNSYFSSKQDSLNSLNLFFHFQENDSLPFLPSINDSIVLSKQPLPFNSEIKKHILKTIKYLEFCYPKIEVQFNVYYKFNQNSDFLRTQMLKYQELILKEMDKNGVSHNRLNFRIHNHENSFISLVIR
jgi:hypothetical protein